jgi:hypothetical protein
MRIRIQLPKKMQIRVNFKADPAFQNAELRIRHMKVRIRTSDKRIRIRAPHLALYVTYKFVCF